MNRDNPGTIHDKLLVDRIILLGTPIDEQTTTVLIARLLYLIDAGRQPISLYVNSPGGSISSSFAIMDVMDQSPAPINSICIGQASGTAAMIVAHGSKGTRFALRNAVFRFTAVEVGAKQRLESKINFEVKRMEELVISRLAADTGQPRYSIRKDMQAGLLLDAVGALDYGLIDQIVNSELRSGSTPTNSTLNPPPR